MSEYKVYLRVQEWARRKDEEDSEEIDLGEEILFNTGKDKIKGIIKSAALTNPGSTKDLIVEITCVLNDDVIKGFKGENDWIDYDINKCVVLGAGYIGEYLCG